MQYDAKLPIRYRKRKGAITGSERPSGRKAKPLVHAKRSQSYSGHCFALSFYDSMYLDLRVARGMAWHDAKVGSGVPRLIGHGISVD